MLCPNSLPTGNDFGLVLYIISVNYITIGKFVYVENCFGLPNSDSINVSRDWPSLIISSSHDNPSGCLLFVQILSTYPTYSQILLKYLLDKYRSQHRKFFQLTEKFTEKVRLTSVIIVEMEELTLKSKEPSYIW